MRHATHFLSIAALYAEDTWQTVVEYSGQIAYAANEICKHLGSDIIEQSNDGAVASFNIGMSPEIAQTTLSMSIALRVYIREQHLDNGLLWLQAGLAAARLLGDARWESILLNDLGLWHKDRGLLEAALSYYRRDESISRELNDPVGLASVLNNLGNLFVMLGEYENARSHLDQAAALYQQMNKRSELAHTLNNLGLFLYDHQDYIEAQRIFEEARSIHAETNNAAGVATSLNNIGLALSGRNKYMEALKAYEQSLEIRQRRGNREEIATTLSNMSAVYWSINDVDRAAEYLDRALVLYRALEMPSYVIASTHNLAQLQHDTGLLDEAVRTLRSALDLATQARLTIDAGRARIDDLQSQLEEWEAEASLRQAFAQYGELGARLLELVNTADWSEARALLEAHPVLASDRSRHILKEIIKRMVNTSFSENLELHLTFLTDVNHYGLNDAFFIAESEMDERDALTRLVIAYVELTQKEDVTAFVGSHQVLLSDDAQYAFAGYAQLLVEKNAPQRERDNLKWHHDLLHLCRAYGVHQGIEQFFQQ